MAQSSTQVPDYIWHYDVHRTWAHESLHYFRLGFAPTYDQSRIVKTLERFLLDNGISSYRRYEIYGATDLILRVWLPPPHDAPKFYRDLRDAMFDCHCRDATPFFVTDPFHHWLWRDPRDPTSFLRPSLDALPNIGLIDAVHSQNRNQSLIKPAVAANILRPYHPTKGILFFVLIPKFEAGFEATQALARYLVTTFSRSRIIKDLAMYLGTGPYEILLKARVDYTNFHKISSHFLDKVNDRGLEHGVKTETMLAVGGGRNAFLQVEKLNVDVTPMKRQFPKRSAAFYLRCQESAELEVKGGVSTDLNRYLLGDGKRVATKEIAKKGVLRSIAAMLISGGG